MVAVVLSMVREAMSHVINLLRIYFEKVPRSELLKSMKAVWV